MTRRLLNQQGAVAAMVFAIASLLAPPPAAAHEDPAVAVRLTDVEPTLPSGVRFTVIDSEKSYLALVNPTATPMFALSPNGDPILQVSADGVFGDVDSPYLSAPLDVVARATPARLACCPEGRWMRLSGEGAWAWPDPRLDPPLDPAALSGGDRGLASLEADRPLATWEIGLRYGETEVSATGVLERRQLSRVRTTLDTVPTGVTATVIDARRPQLRLEIPAGTTFEVLGGDGRAVLRMTPEGSFARADSPEYRDHRLGIGLTPQAETGWVPIGEPTKVTWADPRLGYSGRPPAGAAADPVALGRWRIPVVVDGQAAEIAGTHAWVPVLTPLVSPGASTAAADDGAGGPVAYLIGALLTLALGGAYVLARRRAAPTAE